VATSTEALARAREHVESRLAEERLAGDERFASLIDRIEGERSELIDWVERQRTEQDARTAQLLAAAEARVAQNIAADAAVDERLAQLLAAAEERTAQLVAAAEERTAQLVAAAEDRAAGLVVEMEHRLTRQTGEVVAAVMIRLDALEGRWATEAARFDELSALSGRLDAVLGALNDADADRRDQVAAFAEELAGAKRQLDHIAPLRERCASLSQTTATLQDDLVAHQAAVVARFDDVAVQLREVEDAMGGEGMAAIAGSLDRMEDLERAVAELDPSRFVTKAELHDRG
jgi:hypothetical protein